MRRHPKIWKAVKWTLLTLIGLPILLVVLVLTALAIPFTRRPIVAFALDKTNESLDGMRIELDEVARLDLWGVDVRGARVFDEKKREMIAVARASVRLEPTGLIVSKLHLTDVGVRGVRVHLYPSDEPAKEEPKEESQPSKFQIVADVLRINDASLDMDISGRALHAVINTLQASGAYGPRTWAALQKADVFADVDQQRALTLKSTRATWSEKEGGEAVLKGDLLDAQLLVSAAVPRLDKMEPWPLDRAHIAITGLSNEGLNRLGLADQVQLRVPVNVHVQAQRDQANLNGELAVQLGGERLTVEASATPSTYVADVKLTPSNLRALSGVAPAMQLGAQLHAELKHDEQPMRGQVEWRNIVLDQRAVPNGALSAELALPWIKLTKLTLQGFEQNLKLVGSYNIDTSAAKVELDTSELELSKLGGLLPPRSSGVLNGGVQAQLQGKALKGSSQLSLRYLKLDQTTVDSITVALDLSGSTDEPLGELKLDARQLVVNGTKLIRTSVNAHAGLRELNADLAIEGHDRFVSMELHGTRAADGTIDINADGTGSVADKRVGLTIRELKVASAAYSVRELTAFSGDERLSISGSYDDQQRFDAAVSLVKLDLSTIGRLVLQHELTGTLDMSARLSGTVAKPYVASQIAVYGLHSQRTPRAPKVDLRTSVLLDTRKNVAELSLHAESPDKRVNTNISAKAELAKRAPTLVAAFERARVEIALRAHTDMPFLEQFAPEGLPELEGTIDAALNAQGDLDKASLDFDLLAQLAPRAEVGRGLHDRLEASIRLDDDGLRANVQARDRDGKILDVKTKVVLPEGGPRALMADSKQLMKAPINLDLMLKERRLDQLNGTYAVFAKQYDAALPVRVSANIAGDSDGNAVAAKGLVHAHVWGDGIDPNCQQGAQGDVTIDLALADNKARVALKAVPSGGGSAEVNLDSAVAANTLLQGGPFVWGPLMVRARGDQLALHTFPSLCMLPPFKTQFELSADDVGKGPTQANLKLAVSDLAAGDDAKMGITLQAGTSAQAVVAAGRVTLDGKQSGWFDAKIPLLYENTQVPKVPTDRPISARVQLPKFPVEALTSFTSAVGRAAGEVDINLTVGGTLATLEPQGYVQLHDAAFSLASLAQPFSNINGRIELEKNKLTIRDLKARDRDGKLAVTGYAKYARERGGEAEVHLSADRFPLRQQGSITGELSTRAVLKGKVATDNKMKLALKIDEGRIWLTGQGGRQVQELDEHPDVRFDTDKALLELSEEDEQKAKEGELALESLKIETEKELWVQHEDFSVQVGVDLELTTGEAGVSLEGEAKLVRGDLTLLGKPFRIEKGAIRFTGAVPPDPELDLKAKHRTRQGQTLNVQVTGHASSPQITFSGAANNAGEAALLLSGIGNSNAEGGAKRDAASFAAGLTAGLLAVSARRKFGDWVPMLAIENNAAGAPSGARAGFDASALIPKFMRGFARGMYVEGVVGTRSDTEQRGVGVGVRVEVALPKDFVTSMGYGPGTVWSTDVYWSP